MIDYNTFLANVTDEDVRMMTLAANGQRIATQSPTEADAYQTELTRLFNNGLLKRAERGWELENGVLWHTFDAVVEPLAIAYLIQLAMERYKIHRNPL